MGGMTMANPDKNGSQDGYQERILSQKWRPIQA